ncbi:MAG: 2-dehydropantoate 2-reductase [Archaeoglobaceae archaeon]|nr:2-dehydropantoate 2-reductase [Archaeoglobaceae archaeon]MCX8151716.1 2-dehydropantoate 2-reductase [Archaeoglobaceae archaeon]MDW8013845.1 2-dehydropantoate 2-reductase [Archaeoglobaceae archaeon]
MKIQILGAGALGSLFGALISLAGYKVVFVARGKQFEALKKGLKISGILNLELKVQATDKPEDADLSFITVKAYDTENAVKQLSKVNAGIVCSLQNGIGLENIISEYFENFVRGVTTYAANLADFGHVVFAGKGYTYLGDWKGKGAKVVAEVLNSSGMKAEVVEDVERRVWIKAAINAVINPITALCRVRNGAIVEREDLWIVAEALAEECEKVLKAKGYELNLKEEVARVAKMTALNRSSMLQDVERGKRTEIDFINGAFVKEAKKLGIDCKINEMIWRMVRAVGST